MTDPNFRILLIASVAVLVLAVIDVVRVIRTGHAADLRAENPRGTRAPAGPGPSAGPSATPRRF